ncbi:MAG: hypothetical protein IKR92_02635 [Alphaproteobacteria bacterium]|nr:hypothetical protein [Alphaproteobacteria bacterium]
MDFSTTELAEIVSTRTCHDLIGNIGTLKNVLELIEPNTPLDSDTQNLLDGVSFVLNARQKFFRMAFGLETHAATAEDLLKLCADYVSTVGTHGYPIQLNLRGASPQLSKPVCLCVMIAADVFIRSGSIDIDINKDNITVRAVTDFKFNENEIADYQKIIANQRPESNISQYAQLIYLRNVLGENVPMKLNVNANEMTLVIG